MNRYERNRNTEFTQPHEQIMLMGRLPVFRIDRNRFITIKSQDGVHEQEMSTDLLLVQSGNIAFTQGANPCLAGVIMDRAHRYFLFHSVGDNLPDDILTGTTGIIGGSNRSLIRWKPAFVKYTIVWPNETGQAFEIAIVRRPKLIDDMTRIVIPQGIYVGYSSLY